MEKWIKNIGCRFGMILTFVWASSLVLQIPMMVQLNNTILSLGIFALIVVAGLIGIGFYLSNKCEGRCEL